MSEQKEPNKGQKIVDASRLVQAGIRNDDPSSRGVGFKRLTQVVGGTKALRIYHALNELEQKRNPGR